MESFRYSCRKMEMAAQDTDGLSQVVCGLQWPGSDKLKLKLMISITQMGEIRHIHGES